MWAKKMITDLNWIVLTTSLVNNNNKNLFKDFYLLMFAFIRFSFVLLFFWLET